MGGEMLMRPVRAFLGPLVLVFLQLTASAAQVRLISYQGHLANQDGVPITGTVSLVLSLYDVGTGGTPLWTENQAVPVSSGIFSVQLGAVTPLPAALFLQDSLFLGVKVGADAEMTPRQRLTSTAYSVRSEIGIVPIGAIVAWNKSSSGTPALPDGWVECNGQTLTDPASPYHLQSLPNLNANRRVLKGDVTSGGSSTEDFLPSHNHNVRAGGGYYLDAGWGSSAPWRTDLVSATTSGTATAFFHVVWIMRVR